MTGKGVFPTWPLPTLAAIALVGFAAAGCGSAGGGKGAVPQASKPTSTGSAGALAAATPSAAPAVGHFRGDEDDDENESKTLGTNLHGDDDNDTDNDLLDNAKYGYYDRDDASTRTYGHAAGTADRRAITALVGRYYAAAAAGDGATACSLIYSTFARAIPEDYGHNSAGPAYLRAAKTCPAIMSLLFKHFHGQLAGAFRVTGVRVGDARAFALTGSATGPASLVEVRREQGAWKIDTLLGNPLP